ncbi:MAG: dicarboxylate/amino acid:cation symporter [Lachnoclostridium edouardi]|uniref:dicarboxylate/amino acid:cation symporter n=1 Tax=Lachnoclostridium edouardi TaxID=1926283 RepID=UPI0026DC697A|nr:dicarboxylate/amino acid:cation symporter [Lachnoclostridium edouardi]MDO4278821.1 dicarboxylate/amino acid:cation symporter [Lachnoclostridium edouardi]
MNIIKKYRSIPLVTKLFVAVALGVISGMLLGESAVKLEGFGTLFMNLLKMACIPLVMVNLISGISSLDDPNSFGRIGCKIMLYYLATTVIAAVIGVIGGLVFQPGTGLVLTETYEGAMGEIPTVGEALLGMVPANIFAALTEGKLDQVVVFSAFTGVAILFCPKERKKQLSGIFTALSDMFNKMVGVIMGYAPFGIFALVSSVAGKYGKNMVGSVLKFLAVFLICLLMHFCIYFIIMIFTTKSIPKGFLKKTSPLILTAVSTSSSIATVPVTMKCAEDLGIRKSVYSFTVPLGAQVNKDGGGIMLTVALLFAAQAAGISLTLPTLINAVIIALILTTGGGGIPGGGLVLIAIMIDAFNLPVEAVAVISGVFFVMDMTITMLNCYGDLIGTYIVDCSERKRGKINIQEEGALL